VDLPPGESENNAVSSQKVRRSQEKSIVNLDKYGNTSAASTLMALHEGYKSGKIKEKDKVLLTSFGSGMTYGALIFQA